MVFRPTAEQVAGTTLEKLIKAKIKQDFNDYDIDYSYYLHNARKWINSFNLTQTKLF